MIQTRQEFADYCLRNLGGGVINIEVSDEQVDDAIDDAVHYFQEYHFDGIETDFFVRKITGTALTVDDATGFVVGGTLKCESKSLSAKINAINGNVITLNKTYGPYGIFFAATDVVTDGTNTTTVSSLIKGDMDNGYILVDDSVYSVQNVVNAPFLGTNVSSSDYLFSAHYQLVAGEVQSMLASSGGLSGYYDTFKYLAEMEMVLKKQKTFRFNKRQNKVFLDIDWGSEMAVGSYVVLQVYRALEESTYPEIYNDIWLKRYATALIKKKWGTNTKKYQSIQLPGGITYTGQQIYDEAVEEIKELESKAIEESAPLTFLVG